MQEGREVLRDGETAIEMGRSGKKWRYSIRKRNRKYRKRDVDWESEDKE